MMIQPPDDDERTNSMGLFNTAEAFRLSAMALEDEKVKIGHAASPLTVDHTAHETLPFCGRVVGVEVGIPLVRLSPLFSWTRGSWSTSDCRHGPSSAPEHAS